MIDISLLKKERMSAHQQIQQTTSLCPVCFRETAALLYREGGRIMISKQCSAHGMFSSIVDPDAGLYGQCVSSRGNHCQPFGTVIPISFRCDLDCTWCYLPERGSEPSFEQIVDSIKRCSSRYIVFSGGEPTLRQELPELIQYVRKNYPDKKTVLLTNGMSMASRDYSLRLNNAGLHYCILSFNGFRASTHKALNGRDLSSSKKLALDNLKNLNMQTILSMTLAKGINEDELHDVFIFGMANLDFVRQIRVRNVSEIGKYQARNGQNYLFMSDMLKLVSSATGFSLDELCYENNVVNRRTKTANYVAMNIFNMLKRRHKKAYFRQPFWVHDLGLVEFEGAPQDRLKPRSSLDERKALSLEVFSWPTAGNIDLGECRRFCIQHVTNDGRILPFWEALFRNELLRKQDVRHDGV